jgi:hypothetical protein
VCMYPPQRRRTGRASRRGDRREGVWCGEDGVSQDGAILQFWGVGI